MITAAPPTTRKSTSWSLSASSNRSWSAIGRPSSSAGSSGIAAGGSAEESLRKRPHGEPALEPCRRIPTRVLVEAARLRVVDGYRGQLDHGAPAKSSQD